jgi:hypothetical protein
MTAWLVVAKMMPTKIKKSWIGNGLLGCALTEFKCRQSHKRFERRTRRIDAIEYTIDHRFVW